MRVCILGGGGREHALAWAADRFGHEVVVVPGNAGIPWASTAEPHDSDLYVLGTDDAVCSGQGDRLRAAGHLVFGPDRDGGRLEGSKQWMKELLDGAGVPTARYATVRDASAAERFLRTLPGGYVVKTDYLALGKGVLVTEDLDEAIADARSKLAHGAVVIEERLDGLEFSLHAICDGEHAVVLPTAMDHKRIFDGNIGPNTGGMGAVAPVPRLSASLVREAFESCVEPTLRALRSRGIDYRGVLYGGPLMLTQEGSKVVEWNARWGDPEAQVLLPLFESDPYELMAQAAAGAITAEPRFQNRAAVTVVLASEGYPETPRVGDGIHGLEEAMSLPDVLVFSAGVGPNTTTNGGRVLDVTALGDDVAQARARAYEAIDRITWPGMQHRRDIALAAVK
ncbi:MAG TPA: phosphoribosylamine--glycine ligase [Acidimicrobiales bacterium]